MIQTSPAATSLSHCDSELWTDRSALTRGLFLVWVLILGCLPVVSFAQPAALSPPQLDLPSREVVISRDRFEELQRLASIIKDSNDAIISKTIDGIINGWNGGAERILGYTSQEIVGEPISRLAIAGYEGDLLRRLDTIRKAGER